jgi:peroxiredoxin
MLNSGFGVLRRLTTTVSLSLMLTGGVLQAQECGTEKDPATHTKVGARMPAFKVEEVPKGTFSLADQKGKVVLVNFWATWCGPCNVEMPQLEKEIWSKYKSSDFSMIAIAREQSVQTVAEFQKKKPYTFPLASDPKRTTYALFADSGIPRNYVVDRNGKIVFQSVGYCPAEWGRLDEAVKKALAAK